ncbi:hypothetical protein IscW_ISCW012793 [Ixodes scapularis]|uniref:Uncharacterized protein n=1 Tax=Ixodes scapularis TaxID=6945 RepID=B7QFU3_IXOSC|nr:hypothetical protein IscW_ISCW012793 [Ixodes scapularis]|eukprot:XP_002400943.1 hypothetical protein IscW_ISCW012793 [Ixodes scapularis]
MLQRNSPARFSPRSETIEYGGAKPDTTLYVIFGVVSIAVIVVTVLLVVFIMGKSGKSGKAEAPKSTRFAVKGSPTGIDQEQRTVNASDITPTALRSVLHAGEARIPVLRAQPEEQYATSAGTEDISPPSARLNK